MSSRMWEALLMALVVVGLAAAATVQATTDSAAQLRDDSDGRDWAAYGRTFGERHFSPLAQINDRNVNTLGLAWAMDLGEGSAVTIPLAVDGIVYFASGYSVVHAVDGASGRLLWIYDPKVPLVAGHKLRMGWGSRGIGYWNGKVYTATLDGRLIALDARTGRPVWSVMTVGKDDTRYITGAPRLFAGKVIIGHAGSDFGDVRGYVTSYDAETGRKLWRFFVVPGDPARGFESKAMRMAAATWSGKWWKHGGGGTVWNAITYDAETDTVFLGTGNGSPWNHRIRSAAKGENLFLCSVVALSGRTGTYKWHYQVNPAESWDFDASNDMVLSDLTIDGRERKVLMTAPKNGFFYVLDRLSGKLISAQPIVKVTWATGIDLQTGKPIETTGIRYTNGKSFTMWPGTLGAHNWMPMAFSPQTGFVYIPIQTVPETYSDNGIPRDKWTRAPGEVMDGAVNVATDDALVHDPAFASSELLAWNPVAQQAVWRMPTPAMWNGGVMATAGHLVFQGHIDGTFNAVSANTGELLWSFAAQAPVIAAPITYSVGERQYITVLTGIAGSGAVYGPVNQPNYIDFQRTPKRVLTFALGAHDALPKAAAVQLLPPDDPEFKPDLPLADQGAQVYAGHCSGCHGYGAISGGFAPELRISAIIRSAGAFATVVRGGSLVAHGMPKFEEFSDQDLEGLRQYLRTEGQKIPLPSPTQIP